MADEWRDADVLRRWRSATNWREPCGYTRTTVAVRIMSFSWRPSSSSLLLSLSLSLRSDGRVTAGNSWRWRRAPAGRSDEMVNSITARPMNSCRRQRRFPGRAVLYNRTKRERASTGGRGEGGGEAITFDDQTGRSACVRTASAQEYYYDYYTKPSNRFFIDTDEEKNKWV